MSLPEIAKTWAMEGRAGTLRDASQHLSAVYRCGQGSAESRIDVTAYALARLPATWASVVKVLGEIKLHNSSFSPQSLLDLGAGPGTASWAAAAQWPQLRSITMLDHYPEFVTLAKQLLARSDHKGLLGAEVWQADFQHKALPRADLVALSYALAEVDMGAVPSTLQKAWAATLQTLVILEPGTPKGFERINLCRQWLMKQGAHIAAPCAKVAHCPVIKPDWCHFSVRLPRSREHKRVKGAEMGYEDEKFSYLIAARTAWRGTYKRVLTPPRHSKHDVLFRLCTEQGIEDMRIASRDKTLYKSVKSMRWGDEMPIASNKGDE